MKFFVAILSFALTYNCNAYGQCPSTNYVDSCSTALSDNGNIILSSFPVSVMNKNEQPAVEGEVINQVLNKRMLYEFTIANPNEYDGNLEITLYDKNQNILISNFNKETGKRYNSIQFNCMATDVYNLKFSIKKIKYCGVVFICVVRK